MRIPNLQVPEWTCRLNSRTPTRLAMSEYESTPMERSASDLPDSKTDIWGGTSLEAKRDLQHLQDIRALRHGSRTCRWCLM